MVVLQTKLMEKLKGLQQSNFSFPSLFGSQQSETGVTRESWTWESKIFTFWNLDGDAKFHENHRILFTSELAFVLVINISLHQKQQILELKYWLSLIYHSDKDGNRSLIIVGTHGDKVADIDVAKSNLQKNALEVIESHNLSFHFEKNTSVFVVAYKSFSQKSVAEIANKICETYVYVRPRARKQKDMIVNLKRMSNNSNSNVLFITNEDPKTLQLLHNSLEIHFLDKTTQPAVILDPIFFPQLLLHVQKFCKDTFINKVFYWKELWPVIRDCAFKEFHLILTGTQVMDLMRALLYRILVIVPLYRNKASQIPDVAYISSIAPLTTLILHNPEKIPTESFLVPHMVELHKKTFCYPLSLFKKRTYSSYQSFTLYSKSVLHLWTKGKLFATKTGSARTERTYSTTTGRYS